MADNNLTVAAQNAVIQLGNIYKALSLASESASSTITIFASKTALAASTTSAPVAWCDGSIWTQQPLSAWSSIVSADPLSGVVLPSTATGTICWVRNIDTKQITPQNFGAAGNYGNGNTNDTAALNAWFTALVALTALGWQGVLDAKYYATSSMTWNVPSNFTGLTIKGNTDQTSGIFFANDKNLSITCAGSAFYLTILDVRVLGNIAGYVLSIGKDDYSDAFNSCQFRFIVNNGNQTAPAEGLRLNYVLQSQITGAFNCNASGRPTAPTSPGAGTALNLRQAQFCEFGISAGNAAVGVAMNDGFAFGNAFDGSTDIEEVYTCFQQTSVHAQNNKITGGQLVGVNTFDIQAGGILVCSRSNIGSGYAGWALTSATGYRVRVDSLMTGIASISAAPASGIGWVNKTGVRICLRIEGALTNLTVLQNDGNTRSIPSLGAGYPVTLIVDAADTVTPTYTSISSFYGYPIA